MEEISFPGKKQIIQKKGTCFNRFLNTGEET